MTSASTFFQAWKNANTRQRGVAIACAGVSIALVFAFLSLSISRYKDHRFSEREAALRKEIDRVTVERDEAIIRARTFEELARELETRREEIEAARTQASSRAADLESEVRRARQKMDTEIHRAGRANPDEYSRRIRERLRVLFPDYPAR